MSLIGNIVNKVKDVLGFNQPSTPTTSSTSSSSASLGSNPYSNITSSSSLPTSNMNNVTPSASVSSKSSSSGYSNVVNPYENISGGRNTYNSDTGVYVDQSGQGFSMASAPSGSNTVSTPSSAQGFSSVNPINPSTGREFTSEEAPYGVFKLPDGFGRPVTAEESGQASNVTGEDLFNVATLPVGGLASLAMTPIKIAGKEGLSVGTKILATSAEKVAAKKAAETAAKRAAVMATSEAKVVASATKEFETLGAEALAGNSGKIAANTVVTKTGANSAANKLTIEGLAGILKSNGVLKTIAVGGAIAVVIKTINSTIQSAGFVKTDINNYVQSVTFQLDKLREAGMNAEADALNENVKDLSDGLDKIIPFIPLGIGQNIEEAKITKYQTDLNKIIDTYAKAKVADQEFADRINQAINKGETVSQADLERAAKIDPYGKAKDYLDAQSVISDQKEVKAKENILLSRMRNMNNVAIISDPEIMEWANDPANTYSSVTKLYNSALTSYLESTNPDNYFGTNYKGSGLSGAEYNNMISNQGVSGGQESVYEPPSSLNFGLLRTSGGYELVDKTKTGEADYVTDTDEISQYYFGVSYNKLSQAQKDLVDSIGGK